MIFQSCRGAAFGLACALVIVTSGCSDFLEVTNPGAVEGPQLNDAGYLDLMYQGVVGDFQPAYAWTALFSGAFTDELRMHHTFAENLDMDQRNVAETNGTYALAIFNGLHRARFLADSSTTRYQVILGDTADADIRYAKILTFAGYAWTLLGEQICETRINAQGQPLTPAEQFAEAVERFDAAIASADQVRAAAANITNATIRARVLAGADSVQNLARVGAARASLNLGNTTAAIAYAQAVTPAYVDNDDLGFRFDLFYQQGTRRIGNPFWEFISAGGSWVSISGTGYENLNDPRVPHEPAGTRSVFGGGAWFVPNAPRSFNTWDGTAEGSPFVGPGDVTAANSSIRLGSAVEARYIIAEAQGNTAANVLFLNEQRAIGGELPLVAPTDAEYSASLREQRAREFFIDGHRLGDLRRYEELYGVDLWPSGNMYGGTTPFGDQKCWPTPISELF